MDICSSSRGVDVLLGPGELLDFPGRLGNIPSEVDLWVEGTMGEVTTAAHGRKRTVTRDGQMGLSACADARRPQAYSERGGRGSATEGRSEKSATADFPCNRAQKVAISSGTVKRMMGLEPTTFCMVRSLRGMEGGLI
jgi:hypothetical protein